MAKERNKTRTPSTAASRQSRTAERRKERERERRRQQLLTYGIIAVAVIALAAFIFFIVTAPAEAPIPEAALTRYDDVPQSRTQEGYPRLGDPSDPVQVAEYSSFDCPHCREFHDQTIDAIVERVRGGDVAFTYVPLYGYGGITNGLGAASASLCAADQGAFWTFHDALFDWQGTYGNQAFTNNRIQSGVDALELDRAQYNACISSGSSGEILERARNQALALLNFVGTPTITINGVVPLDDSQQPLSDPTAILERIDAEVARARALRESRGDVTPETTAEPVAETTVEPTDEPTPEVTAES